MYLCISSQLNELSVGCMRLEGRKIKEKVHPHDLQWQLSLLRSQMREWSTDSEDGDLTECYQLVSRYVFVWKAIEWMWPRSDAGGIPPLQPQITPRKKCWITLFAIYKQLVLFRCDHLLAQQHSITFTISWAFTALYFTIAKTGYTYKAFLSFSMYITYYPQHLYLISWV